MKKIILLLFFVFACGFFDEASAHPSWAIVVDDKNQIYVSDLEKIWKIDAAGKVSVFSERHTHEMTLDKDGNLLGEELHYEPSTQKYTAALWRITPSGEFSYTLAPTETPPKGVSIWKNAAGDTYYLGQTEDTPHENFLLKRSAAGRIKVLFGDDRKAMRERQIVPYSVAGMAFAPDGSLYVKNATNIWKVTPDDKVAVLVNLEQERRAMSNFMLFGLAIDEQNNVYTADLPNKRILKIAADKKISVIARSEKEWSPTGVYYRNKTLYFLESKNVPVNATPVSRVQKIEPDGKVSIVATIGERRVNVPANENQENSANSSSGNQSRSINSCAALGLVIAALACALFKREIETKI
jgi:sugar lactone lactonase YvrE